MSNHVHRVVIPCRAGSADLFFRSAVRAVGPRIFAADRIRAADLKNRSALRGVLEPGAHLQRTRRAGVVLFLPAV